ncbi:hypothetical protein BaRGS_00014472 [Batillaria attramentaria]|uniref:MAP3K HisK-N-like globin domain-containing protein n=1 Tax=Batillaria attramentaria TaxID=370345 RepID=A0ABD0L473_9CAEN
MTLTVGAVEEHSGIIDIVCRYFEVLYVKFDHSAESNLSTESSPVSSYLLSPDIDAHDAPSFKDGGFYLLRKDSERRHTLVHILSQDMDKDHLKVLLIGLKSYIKDQQQEPIREALNELREGVQFDASALMEIQLALYVVQEAVSSILKTRNIKPHWMFALDNLVRVAVQTAITVLSPELGANLAEGLAPVDEEVVTSGVSSANSAGKPLAFKKIAVQELYKEFDRLQEENVKMMQELVESQKSYQQLLTQTLQEKRLAISQLQLVSGPSLTVTESGLDETDVAPPHVPVPRNGELVNWLQHHNFEEESIDKICEEEYTLQDLLELVTWEDLRQLSLSWCTIQTSATVTFLPDFGQIFLRRQSAEVTDYFSARRRLRTLDHPTKR